MNIDYQYNLKQYGRTRADYLRHQHIAMRILDEEYDAQLEPFLLARGAMREKSYCVYRSEDSDGGKAIQLQTIDEVLSEIEESMKQIRMEYKRKLHRLWIALRSVYGLDDGG